MKQPPEMSRVTDVKAAVLTSATHCVLFHETAESRQEVRDEDAAVVYFLGSQTFPTV